MVGELTIVAHVGSRCSWGVLLAGHGVLDLVDYARHNGGVRCDVLRVCSGVVKCSK